MLYFILNLVKVYLGVNTSLTLIYIGYDIFIKSVALLLT